MLFRTRKLKTAAAAKTPKTHTKAALTTASARAVESLESRTLLSTWSTQDVQIGLDKAAANYPSINGSGEAVVVIDVGGVDYNHYALGSGYGNKVVYAHDFNTGSWDVMPYNNDAHGTGVAGQMAGTLHDSGGQLYQGVAPGAKVIALRASGSWAVKQAFDWVVANRAAYNIVGVNYTDQTGSVDQTQIYGDLMSLKDSGVFVGGPVGNYGGTAYGTYNHGYYQTGSVNAWNGISSFTPGGSNLDFVAPGENVTLDYYYNGSHIDYAGSGTSWSSPQVVGAAALIHQVNPGFSVDQVAQIIRDSGTWVYDSRFGMSYPMLNVNAAIQLAYQRSGTGYQGSTGGGTTTTPPPATTTTQSPFKGSAFATGTAFKAIDFDNGGEGVSYHDTTSNNEGGVAYRNAGVDIGWTNSLGGTGYVGWTHAGEWMEYTINASASGSYSFAAQAANVGAGAAFHVEVDGTNVTGTINVGDTGGWDNYTTLTKSGIWLNAGQHVVKIVMDGNDPYGFAGNYASFNFTPATAASAPPPVTAPVTGGTGSSTPFSGTPIDATSVIKADSFDNGGEGVAFHDSTGNNEGGAGRSTGVDLGWTSSEGGANYLGWTHAGEWLNYTINVGATGTYTFNTRAANVGSGAAFHVEIDGVNVGSVAVGNTGSFDAYTTLSKSGINLSAGKHVMRIVFDSNSQYGFAGNFASFQFTGGGGGGGTTTTPTATATTVPNGPYGASMQALGGGSVKLSFYDNSTNETQYVIERAAWNGGAYSVVGTVTVDAATQAGTGLRTWTDTGITPTSQNYYYRISARNSLGSSGYTYVSGWVS